MVYRALARGYAKMLPGFIPVLKFFNKKRTVPNLELLP
jgi:hypothetical protein